MLKYSLFHSTQNELCSFAGLYEHLRNPQHRGSLLGFSLPGRWKCSPGVISCALQHYRHDNKHSHSYLFFIHNIIINQVEELPICPFLSYQRWVVKDSCGFKSVRTCGRIAKQIFHKMKQNWRNFQNIKSKFYYLHPAKPNKIIQLNQLNLLNCTFIRLRFRGETRVN